MGEIIKFPEKETGKRKPLDVDIAQASDIGALAKPGSTVHIRPHPEQTYEQVREATSWMRKELQDKYRVFVMEQGLPEEKGALARATETIYRSVAAAAPYVGGASVIFDANGIFVYMSSPKLSHAVTSQGLKRVDMPNNADSAALTAAILALLRRH